MEHTFENFHLEPQTTIALRWEKWINRFDIFLVARNINNGERKKAMLLHSAGEEVYDVYDSLQIPAESTYDQFKTLLSEYFAPKRNMQYERYVFRNESQSASQTIDSYYTKLKGLAKHCEFADIDGEIFSQIIQRCSDNHVHEKGLSEPDLSLQNLLLYARSRESVRHHSNMMTAPTVTTPHPTPRPAQNPEGVQQDDNVTPHLAQNPEGLQQDDNDLTNTATNHIRGRRYGTYRRGRPTTNRPVNQNQQQTRSCGYCGSEQHTHGRRYNCAAYNTVCNACGIMGHFTQMCRRRRHNEQFREGDYNTGRSNNANNLVEDTQDASSYDVLHVNDEITCAAPKPYYCTVYLNGVEVVFEIDTGTGRTLICEHDYYRVHNNGEPYVVLETRTVPRLRAYSGNIIDSVGCIEVNVKHNTSEHKMRAIVAKSRGPNLLGRDWLAILNLDWSTIASVEVPANSSMYDNYDERSNSESVKLSEVEGKFHVTRDHVPGSSTADTIQAIAETNVPQNVPELPHPVESSEVISPIKEEVVFNFNVLNKTTVTSAHIARWTECDPILSKVKRYVIFGWPDKPEDGLFPYSSRRAELSVQQQCLLWGSRVVIPPQGRKRLVDELHHCHPGMVRMKVLARSYMWWPSLDKDLERRVRCCEQCQQHSKKPALAQPHPFERPDQPWYRIHIDHAEFEGQLILVIVDSHSKFIDAHIVPSTSSAQTIRKLRQTFATHGHPHVIMSDNATSFTSPEFQNYCTGSNIKLVHSSPFHPASNGLAEKAVQTVKSSLKKMRGDLEYRLLQVLFKYRITPHTTTGETPAQLLMGRLPRSKLSAIIPDVKQRVTDNQHRQIAGHGNGSNDPEL